jgi:PadR family transcriptional regulator, regulatory protein PadR
MGADMDVPDLLPGTLDLLILRILAADTMHGYAIAQRLKLLSKDVLQVGESSLYPALQRLLLNGYVDAEWGPSENNRKARFYTITRAGRKQLAAEREEFEQLVSAIQRVLQKA